MTRIELVPASCEHFPLSDTISPTPSAPLKLEPLISSSTGRDDFIVVLTTSVNDIHFSSTMCTGGMSTPSA